jgi:hypothetical protein
MEAQTVFDGILWIFLLGITLPWIALAFGSS